MIEPRSKEELHTSGSLRQPSEEGGRTRTGRYRFVTKDYKQWSGPRKCRFPRIRTPYISQGLGSAVADARCDSLLSLHVGDAEMSFREFLALQSS